jgi:hypothetical protein
MSLSSPVLFQSTLDGSKPYQQLSNLQLTGLSTNDNYLNTDNGKLYGTFTHSSNYVLSLYKDATRTLLVAHATSSTLGTVNVVQDNSSGLSGKVNFAQYLADDLLIEAICFVSKDSDIRMSNLSTLADYDPVNGFAVYHLDAFDKIKEVISSKFKSIIWNPDYIDTRNLNGATGGYDLSRCLNLLSQREAASHYALYLICAKQTIEKGSIFDIRARESYDVYKAYIGDVEVKFDDNADRVEDRSRSTRVFKISR